MPEPLENGASVNWWWSTGTRRAFSGSGAVANELPNRRRGVRQGVMRHDVGVWIDHQKAVIVSISAGHVTTSTLESDVAPHPHYAGSQEGGGEKKYEERHNQDLDRFYDAVIGQLGQPDALLLFGPGEAKRQLEDRLARSTTWSESRVAVETTDKLTDPQIVAKVKEHYGIAR